MHTSIPPGFEDIAQEMREADAKLRALLAKRGMLSDDLLDLTGLAQAQGIAAARSYPIQGILKYHGMADWHWRTAYLPSISVNSDVAYTLTLVEFSSTLETDQVTIGGRPAAGRELGRVVRTLDEVRRLGRFGTRARVVSRNVVRASKTGKGLGTSASASAALALATISAAFGDSVAANQRLVSCLGRLLAGSGCRSVVGGIGLWLSYPGIAHEDCFAVRLDIHGEMDDLRLVTVPLDSRLGLKTELAHRDAPSSPFFRTWVRQRFDEVVDCILAIERGDWRAVGQWAELDSIRLHGVTMSGSRENKLFAWEPENIPLFRMCNNLRSEGVPVYFSTDTGPTTVFLTHKDHEEALIERIHALDLGLEIVRGKLGGPAELVPPDAAARELAY